jgi:flagellin
MGLRVNTNIFSMTAQRNLGNVTARLQGNYSRLASGMRIATAADDAAGLGISERMRAQIRSLGQTARNAQDGVSLVQTAEGALNEVSANLVRMRELSIQAASGTLSTADRVTLDAEFQALEAEIDRIAGSADFNGISLLDSTQSLDIQVGLDAGETIALSLVDTQASTLSINGLDITSASNASDALDDLDAAINTINDSRGQLGAAQNRLESAMRSILNARESLSQSESRIRDVDVAAETADLTRNSIMQQAATSILAQANSQPQLALSLLQG